MKPIRRTILGMFLLISAALAAAGSYGYYIWNQSDKLLLASVLDKLHEIAPGWNVAVGRARFDLQGRVHLYDVVVPGDHPSAPILEVGEAVFTFDRATMTDPNPSIQHIEIERARSHIVRLPDGTWNVQNLPPLNLPKSATPECRWKQSTLVVVLPNSALPPIRVENLNIEMIPSGMRQFAITAGGSLPGVETVSLQATWNIEEKAWSIRGETTDVRIDRSLSLLLSEFSPDLKEGLIRFDEMTGNAADGQAADHSPLTGLADVQFRVARWQPDAPAEYQSSIQLKKGELNLPRWGYPLRELRGHFEISNGQMTFRDLSAQSDQIRIHIERGAIVDEGDRQPADFDVVVTGLPLDDRLYRLLPPENQRFYDSIRPEGQIDARLHFEYNGRDRWEHDGEITARDCSAAHVKFPYRVKQINGLVKRQGNLIDVTLSGVSDARRITLKGRVKNPGEDTQALFSIQTDGLPLDKKFRDACPKKFQAIIAQLGLDGEIDGSVVLTKQAGPDSTVVPTFKGHLKHGSLCYLGFRYPLNDVSGDFEGNLDEWTFSNFQGRQGPAELTFGGEFRADEDGTPRLNLDIVARQLPCDRVLQGALPKDWQSVWNELNPQGSLNATGHIEWTPGAPFKLKLDGELFDGKLALRSFPLPLDDVHALVGFDDGRVSIKRLSARRDEMTLLVKEGWADFPDDGEWRLRLVDVKLDELDPNRKFRKALPERLRAIVDSFDPRGRLSISGMLELRGKKSSDNGEEYPVTAAWDTITVYSGNTITAGIDLKEMHGEARFSGTWDGEAVSGEGRIDLKSVKVFDYHLTEVHGPVSINGVQLIVGSKDAANRKDNRAVNNAQRLTARFIGGLVGLDAVVYLRELPSYKARITLTDGELQRFAQTYMVANHKLAGTMNGWVDLQGEGTDRRRLTGTGQLVISRAALYELPVIVAILNALTLTPTDKTAFNQASFMFSVGGGLVRFDRINLVGDSISLFGGGTVRFDGSTNLDFLSSSGRKQIPIPGLRELLNETTKGLVGVSVRGSIKNPVAEVKPFRQVEDALRMLFGNFEPRNGRR